MSPSSLAAALGGAGDHPAVVRAQLGIGIGLFLASFLVDKRGKAWLRRTRGLPERAEGQGRRGRWSALLAGPDADLRVVAGVALAAGLVEAASMVPYLGAVGILAGARLPWPFAVATLLAYVVVMALPVLLLLCARLAVGDRAFGPLQRLKAWIERNAGDTLAWILGIVGFLLAADAAGRLAAAAEVGASYVP